MLILSDPAKFDGIYSWRYTVQQHNAFKWLEIGDLESGSFGIFHNLFLYEGL